MSKIRGLCADIHSRAWREEPNFRLGAAILLAVATLMVSSIALAGNLDKVVYFHIKTQPLEKALLQFGEQAHEQIVFASKSAMARSRTAGLTGKYTGKEALTDLLKGSKFEFMENGDTAEIVPSALLPSAIHNRYDNRADPIKRQTAPARGNVNPETAPQSSKKTSAKRHKTAPLQEVMVTGTHIRGVPVSSALITITRQDIARSGYTTVGALIRSLPQNFGNTGSQTAIGSAPNANSSLSGAPSPNLSGLGAGSTLTLVDGKRLAVDAITGSVDISLIPLPVVDHIDVLTGGASAIYGSDAVAGVVNFVLKQKFNGAKTTILGGGTSGGGGTERYVNQMVGKMWSTGEVLFDFESDRKYPIRADQRYSTESAVSSTTTIPGESRSSFFVNARENDGKVSASITGLYTHRTQHVEYWYIPQYGQRHQTTVHQFAVDGGLDANLSSGWLLSIFGNIAEQRSTSEYVTLTSIPIPSSTAPFVENEGQLKSFEVTANGPIFTLPSGKIRGAVGIGYRKQVYIDETSGTSNAPGAHRTVKDAYGELSVPIIGHSNRAWRHGLAMDVSGRFEHYSDFGSESVPKIGLVYAPSSNIKLRGTWGKVFHAPSLYELFSGDVLIYWPLPTRTGTSDVLVRDGGNRGLKPETAKTWTLGIDYLSSHVKNLRLSVTYFSIDYRNRVARIPNLYTALIDPLDASLITHNPSQAEVESLLNSTPLFINIAGTPVDSANVPAIVDYRDVNISSESVRGANIDVRYHRRVAVGEIESFANAALLDLRQKLAPGARGEEISGQAFEPPKVRARGGLSWVTRQWTVTGIVNYSGPETNKYQQAFRHVASWTTVDFNLAWHPTHENMLGKPAVSLSIENVLNRKPPFLRFDEYVPGIAYDPLNANVLGRVARIGATWTIQ